MDFQFRLNRQHDGFCKIVINALISFLCATGPYDDFEYDEDDNECVCDDEHDDEDCKAETDRVRSIDDDLEEYIEWARYEEFYAISQEQKKLEQKIQEENRRKFIEQEHERKLKRIRRRAFGFNRKRIPIGYSLESLKAESAHEVRTLLQEQAFTVIRVEAIKDIGPGSCKKVAAIERILIDGKEIEFQPADMFPYDAEIKLFYHAKKDVVFPFSAKMLRKGNAFTVRKQLQDLGFTNVGVYSSRNLFVGKFKNGRIKKLTIDGNTNYNKGIAYPFDVKIDIEYYSSVF